MSEVPTAVAVIIGLAAVVTALATLHRYLVRPTVAIGLEVRELLRDLRGYPGRPGHPPRPGLVETVAAQVATTAELEHKLEAHLEWAEQTTGRMEGAIQEHLVESERTRQAGHREAQKLWEAMAALSGHRDADMRTRHDDPERTDDPEETP